MDSYIVETKSGYFVLVADASDSDNAMKTARTRAPQFGVPVAARLAPADPWDPEPPIALYLVAR